MDPATSQHWRELQSLLDAALDLPPQQRPALLDTRCAGNPALRREAELLLAACERDAEFLDGNALDLGAHLFADDAAAAPMTGRHVGAYRIIQEIGRGGMATVYVAERSDDQYRKRVALKIVRVSLDDDHAIHRFLEERQILATMEHPDIARLLDGGVTAEGLPYIVLEYVDGLHLDEYCDTMRLSVADRLALFCRICAAVQYAHQQLVVHRDLKPSNVLVTRDGAVKLLDFGIAKLLSADPDRQETTVVQRRLTPAYASPEQVRGEPISTASDVYSLGVLLHRLLTGLLPACGSDHSAVTAAWPDAPPPSAIVAAAAPQEDNHGPVRRAARRGSSPHALKRRLEGDLDAIVLRALQPDPADRYASADQFADDIRNHIAARPIRARPVTVTYRLARFARRNRTLLAAATLAGVSLLGGTMVAGWQAQRATNLARVAAAERDRAQLEADHASEVTRFLTDLIAAGSYDTGGDTLTVRQLIQRGANTAMTELRDQPVLQARLLTLIGDAYRSMGLPHEAEQVLVQALALDAADPVAAEALNSLGMALLDQSQIDSALIVLQRALAMKQRVIGEHDLRTGAARNDVGLALQVKGRYDEAEEMFRAALQGETQSREAQLLQATVLNNLGWLYEARGDLAAAESVFVAALDIRRALLSDRHPRLAVSLYNAAYVLMRRDDLVRAEPLARRALEIQRAVFGTAHMTTAGSVHNLGGLLQRAGRLDEAAAHYAEALLLAQQLRGADHLITARFANDYGSLLRQRGSIREAAQLFAEALRVYRLRLGDEHVFTAVVRGNLAAMHLDLGRADSAEALYRSSLATLRAARSEDDPLVATVMIGLGTTLLSAGRSRGEAGDLLRAGLEARRSRLAAGHWQIADAEGAWGAYLLASGADAEALPLLAGAYHRLRAGRGVNSPEARRTLASLITALDRAGHVDSAAAYRAALRRPGG